MHARKSEQVCERKDYELLEEMPVVLLQIVVLASPPTGRRQALHSDSHRVTMGTSSKGQHFYHLRATALFPACLLPARTVWPG